MQWNEEGSPVRTKGYRRNLTELLGRGMDTQVYGQLHLSRSEPRQKVTATLTVHTREDIHLDQVRPRLTPGQTRGQQNHCVSTKVCVV